MSDSGTEAKSTQGWLSGLIENIKYKCFQTEKINKSGTYLGHGYSHDRRKNLKVYLDQGHLFCVGATGSGKTNTMVYMMIQDLAQGYNVVYIDPKGEMKIINSLIETASLEKVNRQKELMVLNPFWGKYSARLNPLYCDGPYSVRDEVVNRIMASIPESKEQFYSDIAYKLLSIIIASMSISEGFNNLSYSKINEKIGYHDVLKLKDEVGAWLEKEDKEILKGLEYYKTVSGDWFEKVTANISNVVFQLSTGLVKYCIGTSEGSTDKSDILKRLYSGKGCIAAILIPSMKLHTTGKIAVKAIFSALSGYISEMILQGKQARLRVYVDEARDVLYKGCSRLFTQARAADCFIRLFTQSIEGLNQQLGEDEVFEILQNCRHKLIHRCEGVTTAEALIEILSDVPVQIVSQDQDGETRTMGHVMKEIAPNDIARLEVGEYYLIKDGGVVRGYCPVSTETKINIVDGISDYEDGILKANYQTLACENWIEDTSEEKRYYNREYNIEKIYEVIESEYKEVEKHFYEIISLDSNAQDLFAGGKVENIRDCVAVNAYYLRKRLKIVLPARCPDLFLKDDSAFDQYISRYFINRDLQMKMEGIERLSNNTVSACIKFTDMRNGMENQRNMDVWLLKSSTQKDNSDFKLYIPVMM